MAQMGTKISVYLVVYLGMSDFSLWKARGLVALSGRILDSFVLSELLEQLTELFAWWPVQILI